MTNSTAALIALPLTGVATDAAVCGCEDTLNCYFCGERFDVKCADAEAYDEAKRWEKRHCLDCGQPWAEAYEAGHCRGCGTCPDLPHQDWCER